MSTRTTDADHTATSDQSTLAELYRDHGTYLLRALTRMSQGDRDKAEDILQETFLRAWQHLDTLPRDPRRARPWLFTVARRIAIDQHRTQTHRAREVKYDPELDQRHTGTEEFDRVATACDIQTALAQLAPHQRDILTCLHLHGQSTAQTAENLNIPPGTVKSRNHYAIRALRHLLDPNQLAA